MFMLLFFLFLLFHVFIFVLFYLFIYFVSSFLFLFFFFLYSFYSVMYLPSYTYNFLLSIYLPFLSNLNFLSLSFFIVNYDYYKLSFDYKPIFVHVYRLNNASIQSIKYTFSYILKVMDIHIAASQLIRY